jgi:hypothetical protein
MSIGQKQKNITQLEYWSINRTSTTHSRSVRMKKALFAKRYKYINIHKVNALNIENKIIFSTSFDRNKSNKFALIATS